MLLHWLFNQVFSASSLYHQKREQLTNCIWLKVRLTDEQVPETQNMLVLPLTNKMFGR